MGLHRNVVSSWARAIKQKRWVIYDNVSVGPANHVIDLFNSVFPSNLQHERLEEQGAKLNELWGSGLHFVYNNQSNSTLGKDGYDNYQAPCDDEGNGLFKRRMWVRGTLDFRIASEKHFDGTIRCEEAVHSIRTVGESTFVNIHRDFTDHHGNPLLKETRTLVYSNDDYQGRTLTHSYPQYDSTIALKLTPVSLLKYSMLTYNLHKIHYDKQYCQEIEQLPNTIVHGPFMVTLALYWFRQLHPNVNFEKFTYKNIEPCFVDEEITLAYSKDSESEYNIAIINKNLGKKYLDGFLALRTI
ncbi:uncharacterized protein RJT20DRAFT_54065 [Scheffersomyces xylosifermentans]|uniref:uncharacterized protein n=1 Tax=Scheffersomyces xylosifermentans TaxID=1304137 RepID=UPI00315CE929